MDFLSRVSAAERRDDAAAAATAAARHRCPNAKATAAAVAAPRHRSPSPAPRARHGRSPPKRRAAAKTSPPSKKKKKKAASPSATLALSSGVAASNKKAFVPAQKEAFSVTNQPKLKYGNVTKDLETFGFRVLGPIAAGAFSTIVRAQHVENRREVAIKTFAKWCGGKQAEDHERELEVLRVVSQDDGHPHVATLLNEYESEQGATHAVLVYCGGGSLKHELDKLLRKGRVVGMAERDAVLVTAQISSALGYLHGVGVAHRDIKPANILYDGRGWRLCDFGFAVVCGDTRLKEHLGTPAYSAPELVARHSYDGPLVDMWALGVVLFEMLCGKLPFAVRGTVADMGLRIKLGFRAALKNGTAVWPPSVPAEARSLVSALLSKEPARRPSALGVRQHAWVTTHLSPTGELLAAELVRRRREDEEEEAPRVIGWWCDVAHEGCLRPTAATTERPYDSAHRCWAYEGTYTVCEVCYNAGYAEHHEELRLVETLDGLHESTKTGDSDDDGVGSRARMDMDTADRTANHDVERAREQAEAAMRDCIARYQASPNSENENDRVHDLLGDEAEPMEAEGRRPAAAQPDGVGHPEVSAGASGSDKIG